MKLALLPLVTLFLSLPLAAPAQQPAQGDPQQAAQQAMEKGDYATAETLLAKLAAEHPNNAHVLYDLGFAQEHNGKEDTAATTYRSAIEADPKMIEPQLALGLLDARAGRLQRAHKELESASEIVATSSSLRARAFRAMAQMDANGNTAVASDELLHAIQLDGETPADTLLSAELAERSNALPQAEQAYLKVLSSDPDNVEARVGLGHVFKAENKLADAEAVLQKGLDKHPEDLQLTMQLATVLVAEQKTEQAIPLLEKLRAAAPQGVDLAALTDMLAHIYSANGNMEAAEKLYRQALLKTPDDPRELDALGSLLIREAKFAEAEDLLRRAANQRAAFNDDSAWGDSAGHLAFAASRNGHPQMVLQALAARASVLAETPGTLFLSATAYDSLHQYKDAVKQYKAFLAIAADKFPTEEFQARHRLIALERQK